MSSSPEPSPIDVTRYAEVMAHVRHFPADKHAEVIARLGIRRRDWQAAADRWKAVRDAERQSGKLEVTVRFGRVLADTRARLDARRPPIESLGPYPGPDGLPMATPPPATAPPASGPEAHPHEAAAPAPAVQVPSYVAAELKAAEQVLAPLLARPPVVRPPSALASTTLGAAPATAPAMPFASPVASPAASFERAVAHAERVQGPAKGRLDRPGSGTVLSTGDTVAPSLPAGVANLTVEQYASLRVELEMSPDRTAATLIRYGVPADGIEALREHWRARFSADPPLRMMFAITYAKFVAWFKSHPGAAPPAPPAPTAAPPAPPPSALTLEQYASLRVELEASPDLARATLLRYGVQADGRAALDAHWQGRFAVDPALRAQFARTYAEYVAWFKANAGPPRT